MKILDKPIMPKGFECASVNCGLKDGGKDLSVIISKEKASASGVFTQNLFPGVPVILGREIIKNGELRAIVANSKISNVGTGDLGIENAKRTADAVAKEFGIPVNEVIMSSTGVIAEQLKIELMEKGIRGISSKMTTNPIVAAEGIMTTDTYPKAISIEIDGVTITVVGKGSGMIEPNMATMLVYILTDAKIGKNDLSTMLKDAVKDSFNMLSVDTDTSTSDTCLILANGLSGSIDSNRFFEGLKLGCVEMTKMLARDGEGASKLLTAEVMGAINDSEARVLSKSLINSPLIKTMAYGADPNIGRILMALGKCSDCTIIPEKMEAKINGTIVYQDGNKADFDEDALRKSLGGEKVAIKIDLKVGNSSSKAYGCDLTQGYVEENAAYYSS